jgi:serine acetyltransferase
MGLNCTLKNKISIGSRVIVGCGAAVINDVSDEDIVAGVPAKSIKDKVFILFISYGRTAVIVGLFIAGLAYLQYQQVASINWNRIESTISTIANATTNTFNDYNIETLITTNLGIPLTSSMSTGFAMARRCQTKDWPMLSISQKYLVLKLLF